MDPRGIRIHIAQHVHDDKEHHNDHQESNAHNDSDHRKEIFSSAAFGPVLPREKHHVVQQLARKDYKQNHPQRNPAEFYGRGRGIFER